MRIFECEQNRSVAGQSLDVIEDRAERSAALLRGTESQGRVPPHKGQRQHRGEQRRLFIDARQSPAEHCFELLEPLFGGVVVLESGGAFQLRDEGIKDAVGMIERALVEKLGVLGTRDALAKRRDDARLADAFLA